MIGMRYSGHVSVRDQFYTSILFPQNGHLQVAQATGCFCLSPRKPHLTTTCLPHRYHLTSLCWSHWHTHTANKCSPAAFQSVASTSESENTLQMPKLFPLCQSVKAKKKKIPPPPDFTILHHQAITNTTSSLLALKQPSQVTSKQLLTINASGSLLNSQCKLSPALISYIFYSMYTTLEKKSSSTC